MLKNTSQTSCDPICRSGSLLIEVHDEAQDWTELDLAIYGQEIDNAIFAMVRMNMILHGGLTAEIWKDNTLSRPCFKQDDSLKTFDFAVSNPPFSIKNWSNGIDLANDLYDRFAYGIQPQKTVITPSCSTSWPRSRDG